MRNAPKTLALAAVLATLATLTALAAQQTLPDAADLKKQSESALAQKRSLQFVREITGELTIRGKGIPITEMTVGGRTFPVPTAIGNQTVAVLNPGKARIETQVGSVQTLMVSDGETTWNFRPETRQYSKLAAAAPSPEGVTAEMNLVDVLAFFEDRKSARTIASEVVTIEGRRYECWVVVSNIKVPPQAAMGGESSGGVLTSWIDKQLRLPVQQTIVYNYRVAPTQGAPPIEYSARIMQTTRAMRVDENLSADLFAFAPPADATEVPPLVAIVSAAPTSNAASRNRVDFTGKDAPTFSMTDLDGKPFSLASLKGKTVLLDFWATWCGPCKRSLPVLEKIHQQYTSSGLVILGVDVGETRATVTNFLKTNPMPYPVVLGSESEIQTAYSILVIPTYVLIGPDGKVIAQQFGFNEAALTNLAAQSKSNPAPK